MENIVQTGTAPFLSIIDKFFITLKFRWINLSKSEVKSLSILNLRHFDGIFFYLPKKKWFNML